MNDAQIASNACILIGHKPISALSEDERVEALYPTTFNALLTMHAWRFATKKAQLNQLTGTPEFEYQYKYQLPADFLLLDRTYPSTDYKIYGDELHSNSNEIEVEYRWKVQAGALPDYYILALEYLLASRLAIPITSNKNTAEEYREAFKDQFRLAKFLDSQQYPQDPPSSQPFINARFGDR